MKQPLPLSVESHDVELIRPLPYLNFLASIDRRQCIAITAGRSKRFLLPLIQAIQMATADGSIFRLYLMRHAHAAWPAAGTSDFNRPLDERGQAEARDIARQVVANGVRPGNIVSSPARRCLETAAIVAEALGSRPPRLDEALYSEGVEAYLAQIRQHAHDDNLLLVGHNPMIEGLATMLSVDGMTAPGLAYGYPTAGLLSLEFSKPLPADLSYKGKPVGLMTAS